MLFFCFLESFAHRGFPKYLKDQMLHERSCFKLSSSKSQFVSRFRLSDRREHKSESVQVIISTYIEWNMGNVTLFNQKS